MRVVQAFRGEFGNLVSRHVPWVHALPGPKIVEIEAGMEALYPSADEWRIVPSPSDDDRRGHKGLPPKDAPVKRFVPEPHVRQVVGAPDVVYCPRRRNYGAAKNWRAWDHVEWELSKRFNLFGAGAPETSYATLGPGAWDFERPLDASIAAMRSTKLVIATDAGLAHLAVLCGAPLLLVTYQGRTAPGPQVDAAGRVMQKEYGPVQMSRYTEANHTGSRIETIDGWEHPDRVVQRALELTR